MNDTQSPLRIFVVDDNMNAAVTLGELLCVLGHHVHIFFDGHSGVAAAATLRPAVALVDLSIATTPGYDVAKQLKVISPNTLLVACAGWGAACDRARAPASGFHQCLVKPFGSLDLQRLLSAIPRERTRHRGTRAAGEAGPVNKEPAGIGYPSWTTGDLERFSA